MYSEKPMFLPFGKGISLCVPFLTWIAGDIAEEVPRKIIIVTNVFEDLKKLAPMD